MLTFTWSIIWSILVLKPILTPVLFYIIMGGRIHVVGSDSKVFTKRHLLILTREQRLFGKPPILRNQSHINPILYILGTLTLSQSLS
jgi:hypothetical protein